MPTTVASNSTGYGESTLAIGSEHGWDGANTSWAAISRLRLITLAEVSSCRCISRVPRHLAWEPYPSALLVRDDLGDWTVSVVEHSGYAGSTAGPCTISLQPPVIRRALSLVE